jgi:RNA polymerase sigma-70 factor (ECF subfamily)
VEEKQVIEEFLATRNDEAFCALFEATCVRVRRYFLLRGLDAPTAEDMTQNVFVKVYRDAGQLREADRFYGWLFAVARNEMISYWRREAGPEGVQFEPLAEQHAASLMTEPDILPSMRIKELLKALDPAERDLVVLRFVEGLSYEELAVALKLPLGTIKWRIFNARKKLSRIVRPSMAGDARQRIN